VRGVIVPIERGQVGWSQLSLKKRWRWSRGKVKRFLNELETAQQIVQQKNNITSVVSITNYDLYQSNDTTDGTTDGQQTDTKRTANGHQTDTKRDTNNKNKKEKNNKNDNNEKKKDIIPYKEIIKYFNEVTGKNYKHQSKPTRSVISARISEGFTVDDLKSVIFKKTSEWKGTENDLYLRPETLFGAKKFEGYVNQAVPLSGPKKRKTSDIVKERYQQAKLEDMKNE